MTTTPKEIRDRLREIDALPKDTCVLQGEFRSLADAIDAHIAAVREVIANLTTKGSAGSDYYSADTLQDCINDAADKLTAALTKETQSGAIGENGK